MTYVPDWEIEEELERLPNRHWADVVDLRRAWIEILGRLPLYDYETRARVARLLKAFDDHVRRDQSQISG